MAFIDERLLDRVSYGTQGGPQWATIRIPLRSGIIRRKAARSRPLYRFIVIYQNLREADHGVVIAAFNACMGGVHSFRLKDWSDFRAVNSFLAVGTGDSEQVEQLIKLYEFGNQNHARPIRKPVPGTVTLTADGVPIASVVDYSTGEVTFAAGAGEVIRWSGEFDVPVMFENDELMWTATNRTGSGLVLTNDVTLVEDISV
jgi:uncharacterized protein (TIGR02217 family)